MWSRYQDVIPNPRDHYSAETIWAYLRSKGWHRVVADTAMDFESADLEGASAAIGFDLGVWSFVWAGYPNSGERWFFFQTECIATTASLLL